MLFGLTGHRICVCVNYYGEKDLECTHEKKSWSCDLVVDGAMSETCIVKQAPFETSLLHCTNLYGISRHVGEGRTDERFHKVSESRDMRI